MWTDPASAVAIHVDNTMNANENRGGRSSGQQLRDSLPVCTPNSFPILPFDVAPGDACEYTPPWCSSELCFDFTYVFSAPGRKDFLMPIKCQC